MICPRCETDLPDHFKFCLDCGLNLSSLTGSKGKELLAELDAQAEQADQDRGELLSALKKFSPKKSRDLSEKTVAVHVESDERDYRLARSSADEFIKRKAFDFAVRALQSYLKKHPGGMYEDVVKQLIETDLPEGARMMELLELHGNLRTAYSNKDYLEARRQAEQILRLFPRMTTPAAPTLNTLGLDPQSGPQTAEDVWGATHQTLVSLEEIEQKAEEIYQKGFAQMEEGNLKSAEKLLGLAEKTFPNHPKIREALLNVQQTIIDQQSPLEKFRAMLAQANRLVQNRRLTAARGTLMDLKRLHASLSKSEGTASLFDFQRSCVEYEELIAYLRERETELDALKEKAKEALQRQDYDGCLSAFEEAGAITIEERGCEDIISQAEAILQEIERSKAAAQTAFSRGAYPDALLAAERILELASDNDIAIQLRQNALTQLAKQKRRKTVFAIAAVLCLGAGTWGGFLLLFQMRLTSYQQAVQERNSKEALRLAKLISDRHAPAHQLLIAYAQATGNRQRMKTAKSDVEVAGGPTVAPELWRVATAAEREGNDAYSSCSFAIAMDKWNDATAHFENLSSYLANTKSLRLDKDAYERLLTDENRNVLDAHGGEAWHKLAEKVQGLMALEQEEEWEAAATGWQEAAQSLNQLIRHASSTYRKTQFERHMSNGHSALAKQAFDDARNEFAQASAVFKSDRSALDSDTVWEHIRKAELWETAATAHGEYAAKNRDAAIEFANQALLIEPTFKDALALKEKIEAELSPPLVVHTRMGDADAPGALLRVNGVAQGKHTPATVNLRVGTSYEIEVLMPPRNNQRFQPYKTTFTPRIGISDTLVIQLEQIQGGSEGAAPATATQTTVEPLMGPDTTGLRLIAQAKRMAKTAKKTRANTNVATEFRNYMEPIEAGTLSWVFIKQLAAQMSAEADRLGPVVARSAKARKRGQRQHVNPRAERVHGWLNDTAVLLASLSEQRKIIQRAELQDPLLPPPNTSAAQAEYSTLVNRLRVLEERLPSRKKKRNVK